MSLKKYRLGSLRDKIEAEEKAASQALKAEEASKSRSKKQVNKRK